MIFKLNYKILFESKSRFGSDKKIVEQSVDCNELSAGCLQLVALLNSFLTNVVAHCFRSLFEDFEDFRENRDFDFAPREFPACIFLRAILDIFTPQNLKETDHPL